MFTKDQVMKLLTSHRDGFDFIEFQRSRYVLYVFERDKFFEVRLVQHYIDHFNMKVEEFVMEDDSIGKEKIDGTRFTKLELQEEIFEMLYRHALIEDCK
jgi:hypothetical protein